MHKCGVSDTDFHGMMGGYLFSFLEFKNVRSGRLLEHGQI